MPKLQKRPQVGDTVRIVTPEFGVRIGYPKTIDDFENEAEDVLIATKILGPRAFPWPTARHRSQEQLIRAMAFLLLHEARYGGNERKLYTAVNESYKDQIYQVQAVRIVKEGVRYPGYGGSSHNAYDDAEGPSFEATNTIRLLRLSGWTRLGREPLWKNRWDEGCLVISDRNVEIDKNGKV